MSDVINEIKELETDLVESQAVKNQKSIEEAVQKEVKSRMAEMLSTGQSPSIVQTKGVHLKAAARILGGTSIEGLFGSTVKDDTEGLQAKLYGTNLSKKTFGVDNELREDLLALKRHVAMIHLLEQKHFAENKVSRNFKDSPYFKQWVAPVLKAYDLSTFADFIPTLIPRFYFEELYAPLSIKNYLQVQSMASQLVKIDGVTGRPQASFVSDTATYTPANRTPSSFTLAAKDFVHYSEPSQDLLDDSTPDIMQIIMQEHAVAQLRAIESAIINGDDSGTHMDADIAAGVATLAEKAFKGLRKKALVNSANGGTSNAGNSLNFGVFQDAYQKLSRGASASKDLLWIVSDPIGKMLRANKIPEIVPVNVINTQSGVAAVNQNLDGELPVQIFGAKVYVSDSARFDLNASGVEDGITSDRTSILLVKLSRMILGERAPMRMWMDRKQSSDILQIASKTRYAFNGVTQSADEVTVVDAYNVPIS